MRSLNLYNKKKKIWNRAALEYNLTSSVSTSVAWQLTCAVKGGVYYLPPGP